MAGLLPGLFGLRISLNEMSFWTRNIIVPETQEVRSNLKM
jgi:hypothetical protein